MRIPLWLIAILFVGWSAFSINYWYCIKWGHCGDGSDGAAATENEVPSTSTGMPRFLWNGAEPVPDANFDKFKKNLLKQGGQGDTLLITGLYRTGEIKPGGADNLGLARAAALQKMMMPELPANRVKMAARTTSDNLKEGGEPMPSADFSWRKMVLAKEEGAIIELDNTITILFPFNSTERDKDPKVEDYLKKLGDKHRNTQARFSVVGHTDNVDSDELNIALGRGRAQAIARTLAGYGIAQDRIQVDSKGESEPVADNGTEDGRHQNRRVVITVNQ
jgi:OOP family OmpA-OmpF porin